MSNSGNKYRVHVLLQKYEAWKYCFKLLGTRYGYLNSVTRTVLNIAVK